MEASLNALLKAEGLTLSEAMVLTAIFLEKKRVRPSELAATFETTRGNVSHTISSLEAKRLVRRRIDRKMRGGFCWSWSLRESGRRRGLQGFWIVCRHSLKKSWVR